jgi:hypothetical protein
MSVQQGRDWQMQHCGHLVVPFPAFCRRDAPFLAILSKQQECHLENVSTVSVEVGRILLHARS